MTQVTSVAVFGAGVMGWRIALRVAFSGKYPIVLVDANPEQLERAKSQVDLAARRMRETGFSSEPQVGQAMSNLSMTTEPMMGLAGADLVIEAITEDRKAKLDLWTLFDRHAGRDAILATNSSTFLVSELAAVTRRADRCCGMHFSHPLTMLSMCEVIRGPDTADDVVRAATEFLRSIDCTPVLLNKEIFGQITNRAVLLLAEDALRLVEGGHASVADVDTAYKVALGLPFGPFEMIDNSGVDVIYGMLRERGRHEPCGPPPAILREKIGRGELGRKSGKGFWDYSAGAGPPEWGSPAHQAGRRLPGRDDPA